MRFTISLKPHIHAHGVAEGESTGLGFSGYLTSLIVADLRSRGRPVSAETKPSPKLKPEAPTHDPALAAMLREMQAEVAPVIAKIKGAGRPHSAKNVQKSVTTK